METRRFNWLGSAPSAWQQTQAWAARRRALMEDFAASAELINATIANANLNRIAGLGDLAGQAALKRIQAETRAKFDKLA